MIDYLTKTVMVHVPKTGASSITSAFAALYGFDDSEYVQETFLGSNHDTAGQIMPKLRDWNNYYKFSIVRNPFDRIRSHWNWFCQTSKKRKVTQWEFVHPQRLTTYHRHLFKKNELLVDHVYRYEDGIDSIIDDLNQRLNISLPYKHEKQVEYTHEFEFTDSYVNYILERCAFDFEYFGYEQTLPEHIKEKQ